MLNNSAYSSAYSPCLLDCPHAHEVPRSEIASVGAALQINFSCGQWATSQGWGGTNGWNNILAGRAVLLDCDQRGVLSQHDDNVVRADGIDGKIEILFCSQNLRQGRIHLSDCEIEQRRVGRSFGFLIDHDVNVVSPGAWIG